MVRAERDRALSFKAEEAIRKAINDCGNAENYESFIGEMHIYLYRLKRELEAPTQGMHNEDIAPNLKRMKRVIEILGGYIKLDEIWPYYPGRASFEQLFHQRREGASQRRDSVGDPEWNDIIKVQHLATVAKKPLVELVKHFESLGRHGRRGISEKDQSIASFANAVAMEFNYSIEKPTAKVGEPFWRVIKIMFKEAGISESKLDANVKRAVSAVPLHR